MTLQEMFDVSTRGIIAQGGPSRDERDWCMYRGPNGRKCAVGHLIPDEDYDASMEGRGIYHLSLPEGLFEQDDLSLLGALQGAHDNVSTKGFFKRWREYLVKIANEYELDPKVLEGIPCE